MGGRPRALTGFDPLRSASVGVVNDNEKQEEGAEIIVAFFRSISAAARAEYEELARRDRRYGEDSVDEARS